jgi:hypothetical protein
MPPKKKTVPKKEPVPAPVFNPAHHYTFTEIPFAQLAKGIKIKIPEKITGMRFNTYAEEGEVVTISCILHEMVILENNKKQRFSFNTNNYKTFTKAVDKVKK